MLQLSLAKLKFHNFRCFESLEIDFDPQLTVLVANNGAGKTSVLDGAAIALGPFLSAFDEATGKDFNGEDIRQQAVRETAGNEMEYALGGVALEAWGSIPGSAEDQGGADFPSQWTRALTSPTKGKTTRAGAKQLVSYGKALQAAVRTPGTAATLPLIAYYGTGCFCQPRRSASSELKRTSRTVGYTDCLNPTISYDTLVAWMRYWTSSALQARAEAAEAGRDYTPGEFEAATDAIAAAIDTCLQPVGWFNLRYSVPRGALLVSHLEQGAMPVHLLSDGVRRMISLVADMAFRAVKLNPQFGVLALRKTPGIVLIDEIDLHLHPQWQQVVLASLREAFPKIQFIVTTHSPQVLSSVHQKHIRLLGRDAAEPPLAMSYGMPSGHVLHGVMAVDPQPPVPEKAALQRLTELVDQGWGDTPEARALYEQLRAALDEHHPQLQRLRRTLERHQRLAR